MTHQDGNNVAPGREPLSRSDHSQHGRFLPGTRISSRYRIVSLLGKGGMGEVYRADDLKLGHTVALKFLPKELARDPQRLELFLNEVRLTRQISHPNVCRVYDIGEVDGHHFLSMEYIDGEDLRVLLRRIGRLPSDKGAQFAQQLCAGLAAAHERGVLHRDLKPANVMIDGRGHVRITDFGLAKLADEIGDRELAGTPAYMAPEQLARGEATIQSDLYAFGLILHEVFTGERVHKGGSIPELLKEHAESGRTAPSEFLKDIDPAIERVILRCLEKDPADRPKSAAAVAAALPGGDPLAAALAAGETPSPEMVAAAGEPARPSLKSTGGLLAATFLLLLIIPFLAQSLKLASLDQLEKKPDALQEVATDLIEQLDYDVPLYTSVHSFQEKTGNRDYRWDLEYWYRQGDGSLIPNIPDLAARPLAWQVTFENPPFDKPGMMGVRLDPAGRLLEFVGVPGGREVETSTDSGHYEAKLFAAAGLDSSTRKLAAVPPDIAPATFADNVQFWNVGEGADKTGVMLATRNGRVVHFRAIPDSGASTVPTQSGQKRLWRQRRAAFAAFNQIVIVFFGTFLALRNLQRGRADTKGALRFATYFFFVDLLLWIVGIHHDLTAERELIFAKAYLLRSLGYAVRIWLYYVALEPLVRRYWPDVLISWSRLVAGRYQDTRIGRDLLTGCFWGSAWTVAVFLAGLPLDLQTDTLMGSRHVLAWGLNSVQTAGMGSIYLLAYLLIARILVPGNWRAASVFAIIMTITYWPGDLTDPKICGYVVFLLGMAALFTYYGLVCVMSAYFVSVVLPAIPYTTGFMWYAEAGNSMLVVVFLLATLGFYTSTFAGRHSTT